jgi:membrane-bound serine protease (ClpP class)
MIGLGGTAETALEPEGWVLVQGERWRARAEESLGPGARVKVVAVEGLRLGVRKGA